jgi:phospholipase C
VISPWARQNYIDHTFTDQSSVIKFIEENWGVGGLGGGAFESLSGLQSNGSQAAPGSSNLGDLMSMFDFNPSDRRAPAIMLDDQTGEIIPGPAAGQNGQNGSQGQQGPPGPRGPQGPKGNPGKTPHVVCHVKVHKHRITVKCVEVGTKSKSKFAKARLVRGRVTFAAGSGRLAQFTMRERRRIRHGVYLLTVTVPGAAADHQVVVL